MENQNSKFIAYRIPKTGDNLIRIVRKESRKFIHFYEYQQADDIVFYECDLDSNAVEIPLFEAYGMANLRNFRQDGDKNAARQILKEVGEELSKLATQTPATKSKYKIARKEIYSVEFGDETRIFDTEQGATTFVSNMEFDEELREICKKTGFAASTVEKILRAKAEIAGK